MDTRSNGELQMLDSALLSAMAAAPVDAERAKLAWEEFYRRHYSYLLSVCRRAHSSQLGEGRVPEVVHDVFVKAFSAASTFRPDVDETRDEDRCHVRAWLGTILRNAVADLYRHEPAEVFSEDIELLPDPNDDAKDSGEESPIGPLEQAFLELGDREREVLQDTMLWYTPGAQQQRMPSDALQALATRLNTTPANIRQIRSRAIAKLRNALGGRP